MNMNVRCRLVLGETTFKMDADHLGLHSLVHVSEEPGVGGDRGEDDLPRVRQNEAHHLQPGADPVDQPEVGRRDGDLPLGDPLGEELGGGGGDVRGAVESIVMLPLGLVLKQVALRQSFLHQIFHKSIDRSAKVDIPGGVGLLVILVLLALHEVLDEELSLT